MILELTREEAETLREVVRQRILELDKEINRTDSLDFKKELQQLDRRLERIVGGISSALASAPAQ